MALSVNIINNTTQRLMQHKTKQHNSTVRQIAINGSGDTKAQPRMAKPSESGSDPPQLAGGTRRSGSAGYSQRPHPDQHTRTGREGGPGRVAAPHGSSRSRQGCRGRPGGVRPPPGRGGVVDTPHSPLHFNSIFIFTFSHFSHFSNIFPRNNFWRENWRSLKYGKRWGVDLPTHVGCSADARAALAPGPGGTGRSAARPRGGFSTASGTPTPPADAIPPWENPWWVNV